MKKENNEITIENSQTYFHLFTAPQFAGGCERCGNIYAAGHEYDMTINGEKVLWCIRCGVLVVGTSVKEDIYIKCCCGEKFNNVLALQKHIGKERCDY